MDALMHAAFDGHLDVMMKLAELGVNVAAADNVSNVICIHNKKHYTQMLFFARTSTRGERLL